MGMASCIFWLLGFILLTHWHVYSIADKSSLGFLGCLLKLAAAVFFNLQPLTALWYETDVASMPSAANSSAGSGAAAPAGLDYENVAPGDAYMFMTGWSDFLGICLFHTGNMFSVFHMMRPTTQVQCAARRTPAATGLLPLTRSPLITAFRLR
jgi:hypothetical protein